MNQFAALLNDGFLVRAEALQHLIQSNSAAAFRYYLLIIILVLIELMPVLAKTFLPAGAYEEKVKLQEEMEKTIAQKNIQKETELKEIYNSLSFDQDKIFITQFFEEVKDERKQKMLQQLQHWKKNEQHSLDEVWLSIKKQYAHKNRKADYLGPGVQFACKN